MHARQITVRCERHLNHEAKRDRPAATFVVHRIQPNPTRGAAARESRAAERHKARVARVSGVRWERWREASHVNGKVTLAGTAALLNPALYLCLQWHQ
jgi:hypothetical protein